MSRDSRKRARDLAALAADPSTNPNEAHVAAMQACRLIHEQGLLESSAPSRTWVDAGAMMDDYLDELFSSYQPRAPSDYVKAQVRPPPPQPRVHNSAPKRKKDPEAKHIPVVLPAWCAGCGQRLRRGSFATWSRGEMWHAPCHEQAIR